MMTRLIRRLLVQAVCVLVMVPYPFTIVHAEATRAESLSNTAVTVGTTQAQPVAAASSGIQLIGSVGTWNGTQSYVADGIAYVAAATDGLRVVDVHNPSGPTLLATLPLPGEAFDIYVAANLAYITDDEGGKVYIVDVSTPANPHLKSSFATPQSAAGITVVGSLAYVTDGAGGLQIVDVSNPDHPTQKGSLDFQGYAGDVAVLGNIAIVAGGTQGLQLIDVSNPAHPILRSSVAVNGAQSVYVVGNTVYVAAGLTSGSSGPKTICYDPGGLRIVDISDPAHPALLGSFDTPGNAQSVSVMGSFAYLADGTSLQVIDVRDPRNPTWNTSYETTYNAQGVKAQDGLIYITGYGAGLQILRTAFSSSTQIASAIPNPEQAAQSTTNAPTLESVGDAGAFAKTVAVSGTLAYVGETSQFTILDVSTPAHPVFLTRLPLSGEIRRIQVVGDRAFVANYSNMFQVIDVHDVLHPRLISTLNTPAPLTDLQVVGNLAYASNTNYGVHVIDISNPDDPKLLNSPDSSLGALEALQVVGHYIYAAEGGGLDILDITNPSTPRRIAYFDATHVDVGGGNAFGVYVANQFAYLANGAGGLWIIDVSDPANPHKVGSVEAGFAIDVQVVGTHAYVADRDSGLHVVDVGDPADPRLVSSIDTGGAQRLNVADNIVYVAGYTSGLQIVDIHDPAHPTITGYYATAGNTYQVSVENGYAYLAAGNNGLQVVDVHTPGRPVSYGRLALPGETETVQVADHVAYVGNYVDGDQYGTLQIIDVSTPSDPHLRGSFTTSGLVAGMKVIGKRAYVAAGNSMQIVDVSDLDHPVLLNTVSTVTPQNLDIVNNTAFVAGGYNGFRILDVNDPANVAELGKAQLLEFVQDVHVVGSLAYVVTLPSISWCNPKAGLRIYDVSNPAHPLLRGSFDTPNGARHVQVVGTLAYLIAERQGIQVIDVSDPAHPFMQTSMVMTGTPHGFQVADDLVYVAGYTIGLKILSTTPQFQISETSITASGGTATSADGTVQMLFATNTFTNPVTVLHMDMLASAEASDDQDKVVRSFLTETRLANGQVLTRTTKPYTMQLHYSDEQLAQLGISESSLNVALWNGEQWVDALPCAGCSVDTTNNIVTLTLSVFTKAELVSSHSSPTSSPSSRFIFLPIVRR